ALRGLGQLMHWVPDEITVDLKVIEGEIVRNLVEHLRMISIAAALEPGVGTVRSEAKSSGVLVLGLLGDKAEQALERSFRLLQIAHPGEDIRRIYLALGSNDRRVRAYAQEFLAVLTKDNSRTGTNGEDKRDLLQIASDDLSAGERSRRAARF